MYLYIDSPQHYYIQSLPDYRGFVRCIHAILRADDYIVFRSYHARADVRALLEQHQVEPDEHVLHERRAIARDPEYPEALAVRWLAKPALLNQLADLLDKTSNFTEFCHHIIAYGPRGSLLSFHDAFEGELIVSDLIPEPEIQEFCKLLHVGYKLQAERAFYGEWSPIDGT